MNAQTAAGTVSFQALPGAYGGGHAERVDGKVHPVSPENRCRPLSASSRGTDRGEKSYGYERAGVPGCRLVDPAREREAAYGLEAGWGDFKRPLANARRAYEQWGLI